MRRRRVLTAVVVLLAGTGVLFFILRPSGGPGTTHVTRHGGNGTALAHIKVPVDATEREWRAGVKGMVRDYEQMLELTAPGPRQVCERSLRR